MRRSGDVAFRVAVLVVVWIVLGRAIGLLTGGTPDATIASAVVTTALWYATAGALALRDGRLARPRPYPTWFLVGLISAVVCVGWQWASSAVSTGDVDLLLLRDSLVVLTPGLAVGAWACAAVGLALGRRDAEALDRPERERPQRHRPLTRSAIRAIQDVVAPRLSSRRSAAR
ncbi:hypothetical protein FE697_001910 [Mumia zhuanghuii]|uniref:Integral membrane protein n=2 Tax=Mumia TaxID=1546255 RepID=A0ABW1QJH6_9ACTN|nr:MULTISPECIES: hypothetical protein [Mumia]KAA1424702.1 hypothetical protein FE697_001910 [Mumia zhuanghuii]